MKKVTLLIMMLSIILAASASCQIMKVGQTVTVTQDCVGALDQETLDKANKYSNERNEVMFTAIMKSGYATVVKKGTKVVDIAKGKVRIKLPSNELVWVRYSHVK